MSLHYLAPHWRCIESLKKVKKTGKAWKWKLSWKVNFSAEMNIILTRKYKLSHFFKLRCVRGTCSNILFPRTTDQLLMCVCSQLPDMFKTRLAEEKKEGKLTKFWTIWSLLAQGLFYLKSDMRLVWSNMRKSLVASGDTTAVHWVITSFVLRPLCWRMKRRNPKQIFERAVAVVKTLVPHSLLFLFRGAQPEFTVAALKV